jgi:uncharacterized protein
MILMLLTAISSWKTAIQRWVLPVCVIILLSQIFPFPGVIPPAQATSLYELPDFTEATPIVLDASDVLSRITESTLTSQLTDLAKQTGKSVHVVTVRRLDYEETIDSFTDKLFQRWFPTPDEQANQVLLTIDTLTNNIGIRTGSEVKSIMTDEVAHSVAQETVLTPLKQGDRYNQAFLNAGDRLAAVLSGQPDPGPPEVVDTVQVEGNFASREETKQSNAVPWVIGLLIAATVIPMATYYLYVR